MTDADLDAYATVITRLKLAFDAHKVGKEKIDYLFEKFRHVAIEDFKRAAVDWEDRGTKFPKPADLNESLRRTRRILTTDEMAVVDPDNPYCATCRDSGWQELWCIGDELAPEWDTQAHFGREVVHCGRSWRHGGHSFMKRCKCHSSNPVLKTKKSLAGGG